VYTLDSPIFLNPDKVSAASRVSGSSNDMVLGALSLLPSLMMLSVSIGLVGANEDGSGAEGSGWRNCGGLYCHDDCRVKSRGAGRPVGSLSDLISGRLTGAGGEVMAWFGTEGRIREFGSWST
jgi:hypothetical protein